MRKILFISIFISNLFYTQNIKQKLDKATQDLLNSAPAYSANLSFYVADNLGNLVYEYQGNKGLSTASTQKIFTAAAALETLGKDYRWETSVAYSGSIKNEKLDGNIFIHSTGDPTLGSWRYDGFKPEDFKNQLINAIKKQGISEILGDLVIDDSYFDFQTLPGGWAWNDIGNYYGAGVWSVNWRENQFDINTFGNKIKSTNIDLPNVKWVNELKTGGKSDQSIIYTAPYSSVAYISGMLPEKDMTVSGSIPNPPLTLANEIKNWLNDAKITFNGKIITNSEKIINRENKFNFPKNNVFFIYQSPKLEQIVYWFLRKSVNLYGETFVKTMAKEKKNNSDFSVGIDYLKSFWKTKGINPYMINFADGSGLSPKNYASAKAEVQALLWAEKQIWYKEFLAGFPVQNGMKMKSGTMKYTKSFAGYHTSKNGQKYVFAIILNNYQGNDISSALFKILNELK